MEKLREKLPLIQPATCKADMAKTPKPGDVAQRTKLTEIIKDIPKVRTDLEDR
jgi:hypothetical protein